jgi:hypothetical protein
MRRREFIVAALACGACGRPPRGGESLLPETVGEMWRRTSLREIPPSPAGARRAFEAAYEGPGKLTAAVYEMRSPAGGLDLAQRWKPAADTVFFNQENYFAVVRWEKADRKALTAFVRALEKGLGAERR